MSHLLVPQTYMKVVRVNKAKGIWNCCIFVDYMILLIWKLIIYKVLSSALKKRKTRQMMDKVLLQFVTKYLHNNTMLKCWDDEADSGQFFICQSNDATLWWICQTTLVSVEKCDIILLYFCVDCLSFVCWHMWTVSILFRVVHLNSRIWSSICPYVGAVRLNVLWPLQKQICLKTLRLSKQYKWIKSYIFCSVPCFEDYAMVLVFCKRNTKTNTILIISRCIV